VQKVITAPDELITVAEAAEFMRAEFSASEEDLVESLIIAARQWCEEYLGRAIGVQTIELRMAGFPDDAEPIVLRSPIIEVNSVKYLDTNGDEQTMDEDDYLVSDADPAEIVPVSAWPVAFGSSDSVRVEYDAGYSAFVSPMTYQELPRTIRTAILMMVADMYTNREAHVEKPLSANPTVERLLSQYRLNLGM
jgi:uncharacterized phiE125 gp8 family phage protein